MWDTSFSFGLNASKYLWSYGGWANGDATGNIQEIIGSDSDCPCLLALELPFSLNSNSLAFRKSFNVGFVCL